MKSVVALSREDRSALFSETARAKGMTPQAAEKDFWICWVLMIIFENPEFSRLLRFKGGTSLSKCFGVISRFSEDIDLILDWESLIDVDPWLDRSRTQQDKLNKRINEHAQEYIRQSLLPGLLQAIGDHCAVALDAADPHIISVKYPSIFAAGAYLRPEIQLEIGPLAEMVPSAMYDVMPYAAEVFPHVFSQKSTVVHAIKPERTFWEKVTILHAEAHRPDDKPQPTRYSRHYYDLFKMLGTDIEQAALDDLTLLKGVVAFKERFYPSGWARYDLAQLPTLRITPTKVVMASLKKDYAAMAEMLFGEQPPSFEKMMEGLAAFEMKLNALES